MKWKVNDLHIDLKQKEQVNQMFSLTQCRLDGYITNGRK